MPFAKTTSLPLLSSALTLLLATTAQANPLADPFDYFNVYSLGSINYRNSDFQGKAGAARGVTLNGFSLSVKNPNGYSLHAGGQVTLGSGTYYGTVEAGGATSLANATIKGSVLSGGKVVNTAGGRVNGDVQAAGSVNLTQSYTVAGEKRDGVAYLPSVDHHALTDFFSDFSDAVAGMADSDTITSSYKALSVKATAGTNVFTIDAQALRSAYRFTINGPEEAMVYINVLGDGAAALDSTNWFYRGGITAGDVLLNYGRQTTSLALNGGNNVNILAPFASTTFSCGLITGNLIVGDLSGRGQVNLGHFEHGRSAEPVPEPATLFLLATGLAGLVGARSRKQAVG